MYGKIVQKENLVMATTSIHRLSEKCSWRR